MRTIFGYGEWAARKSLATAVCCAALMGVAAMAALSPPAHAMGIIDLQNGWTEPPSNLNPTGFEYDYQGDVTASIPPQIAEATMVNPFYAYYVYNGTAYNQITVSYDSGANLTRVLLSGGHLPNPAPLSGWPGPTRLANGVTTYHTGLDQLFSDYAPLPPLVSEHWITDQGNFEVPTLGVHEQVQRHSAHHELHPKFAVIYVEVNNQTAGTWHMTQYVQQPNHTVPFQLTNNTGAPITVGLIGYQLDVEGPHNPSTCKRPCAAEEAALASLNDASFPTPGEENSQFKVVQGPQSPLQPGQTFVFNAE